MSIKREMAREIRVISEEIQLLEIKRSRSEAALIESLISKSEPKKEDVEYFRAFTAEIEVKRDRIQKLTRELEKLL